ncbi:hypothetical protein NMY22_g5212 [Coprinellus aureogranulatus]|nr:hypothetical protein NMY22_g5212 [Coprinellus aureogranulatus]
MADSRVESESASRASMAPSIFSPNCATVPSLPEPTVPAEFYPVNPFQPGVTWTDLQKPHRWTKPYGWAGFIPKMTLYSIYPFDTLITIPPLVLNAESRKYSLPQKTITRWTALTISLRTVSERLSAVYGTPTVLPYAPRGWKYGDEGTHKQVLWSCHRSREWYMVWAGALAFQIRHIQYSLSSKRNPASRSLPDWKATVRELGFSAGFIDGLECASSDGIPRAGVFFDSPSQDPYLQYGPHQSPSLWVQAGVPVWYRTHENDLSLLYPMPCHVETYAPPPVFEEQPTSSSYSDPKVAQDSPTSPQQVPSSSTSPFGHSISQTPLYPAKHGDSSTPGQDPPASPLQVSSMDDLPFTGSNQFSTSASLQCSEDVLKGCGQESQDVGDDTTSRSLPQAEPDPYTPLLVEARRRFMVQEVQHMLEKEQNKIAGENAKERQARMNREREPATTSAKVVEWDINFDKLTEMKERTVTSRERVDVLENHTGKTRRYFPAHNLWWCSGGIDIGDVDYGTDEWDDMANDCPITTNPPCPRTI